MHDIIQFNGSENAFVLKIEDDTFYVEHENSNALNNSNINAIFHKKPTTYIPLIFDRLSKIKPFILKSTTEISSENANEKRLLESNDVSSIIDCLFTLISDYIVY